METFVFICHRPYHYFVAAALAKQKMDQYPDSSYFCFNFDVYTFNDGKRKVDYSKDCDLSSFETLLSDESFFQKTVWLTRKNEKSIWNLVPFLKYYNETVRKYKALINSYTNCDHLYIFSDKEKPVEILTRIIIEKFNPTVYLIDEGVVSYYYRKRLAKKIIKWSIVNIFRLKYIADNYNYGESDIYDYFITYDKSKIAIPIKKNILEVKPFDLTGLIPYLNVDMPIITRKTVLYISTPISEAGYDKEEELNHVKQIIDYWHKLGYLVLLKLHPLERADKYNDLINQNGVVVINNKNIPPELFYAKIKLITGLSSSALLNASRMEEKIIISYNNIFNWDYNDSSKIIALQHGIHLIEYLYDIDKILTSTKDT
jgi:hypothetical protein